MITWQVIKEDRRCMNMAPGGEGGDTLSQHPNKEEIYATFSRAGEANGMYGRHHTSFSKELMSINRRGTSSWNKNTPRTAEDIKSISVGAKRGMREPVAWNRFMESVRRRAESQRGSITIWKNGKKRILRPEMYDETLIADGWVRSKAASLSASSSHA